LLNFKGLQIVFGLTANFGGKSSRFLLSNFKISPRDLRSSLFPAQNFHEKSLQNNAEQIVKKKPGTRGRSHGRKRGALKIFMPPCAPTLKKNA
jgi:hypothetical protein